MTFAELRARLARDYDCELLTLGTLNDKPARFLSRPFSGGGAHTAFVDHADDVVLTPTAIRSILVKLAIDPSELGIPAD